MSDSTTKQCNSCQRTLPRTEFSPDRRKTDGLQSMCRKCRAEREAARRSRNPEKCKESNRRSYLKHHDRRLADARAWYSANREQANAGSSAYHKEHAEQIRNQVRSKWRDNPQLVLRWKMNTHESNPTKLNARRCVNPAVRAGVLVKPESCSSCGAVFDPNKPRSLQAHHSDYTKPLDVVWLCPKCHAEHHPNRRIGV